VFSITILPLVVLFANLLFKVKINRINIIIMIFLIITISFLIYLIRTQRLKTPEYIANLFGKIKKEEAVELLFFSDKKEKSNSKR
ncbi:MAG: hypothetical protein N3D73_03235, partial [Candidatus Diapherotrites archaeon]|nr:hypothetical protein [Candidatus Diapherotrites archaeon]